jgi:hypothetical protein
MTMHSLIQIILKLQSEVDALNAKLDLALGKLDRIIKDVEVPEAAQLVLQIGKTQKQ